jgi:tetratricopeptide (TPR) repeat protein
LSTLGITHLSSGDLESARADLSEALALFRQCAHRVGEAISQLQLGEVEMQRGQTDTARTHLQAALAIAREIKHPETEGEAELVLGEVELEAGRDAEAERHFQRSLAVCTAAGDRRGEATARWSLGRLDLRAGRLDAAQPRLREALIAFDEFDMRGPWVGCVEDHATLALAWGQATAACGLAAAAQRLRDSAHLARSPLQQQRWLAQQDTLRAALGAGAFDAAWALAQDWETAEVRRQALAVGAAAPASA